MAYKKFQKFTEDADELDFTIVHEPDGELPLEAIAYEAGKAAYRAGVKRKDNPEDDILLADHWSNGWDIERSLNE